MKRQLLIPAAGMGLRLGAREPKALTPLGGRPLLARTLERFSAAGLVEGAVIIVPDTWRARFAEALAAEFPGVTFLLAPGGEERQASVANGLDALGADTELVLVHDAARPFVSAEAIEASCAAAEELGAATVALPCADTILQADADTCLEATPPREKLWQCQTPQTFQVAVLRDAHRRAREEGHLGTDDASLVRRMGGRVKLVLGTPLNFKITTPADLALAELVLREDLA